MTRRILRLAAGASFTSFLVARALTGEVVVSALPAGMLQLPAQATATDRFSLTNNGGAAAEVTLSASGGFFSAAPPRFTLPARSTQIVTVTAEARPAGVHIGSIAVTSPGSAAVTVPVKLLVTQSPSAAVSVEPNVQRIEVRPPIISPPPRIPSGFTNRGTEAITGLVVADSSWIELLDDAVTIPAGRSYDVGFLINREKRPDSANPVGSATGRISLKFFSSTSSGGTPSVSLVSVVVIDLNDPSLRTGTPPPLATGDLAFFVPGFSAGVDVSMFAGGASAAIDDLRLYFARPPSGLPSSFAAFSRVPTKSGFSFVDIVPRSGGTQVRSSDPIALNLAAVKVVVDDGDPFTSLLPILRSDQGVPFAGTIFLTGVAKDATTHTDVHLQEVAGQPAFARIDYLDEAGLLKLTLSYELGAFESVHLPDAVPAGVSTAVITNLSGGTARIAAVALVADSRSGDSWAVTDATPLLAPGTELLVPILVEDATATPVIHLVNRSSEVALTRVEVFRAAPGRRRAAKRAPAETNGISVPLAPKAAARVVIEKAAGGAYARITSAGGSVTASARTVVEDDRGTYGSPLPVFPRSAVLRAGQSRRFAGVDDAEPSTAAARTPLTFRSELMLVETSGQPATVRLRLRYVATAGLAIAHAFAERELEIGGGAFVFLRPLARAIIGNGRDAFGDLRNMELTVEVIGGSGAVTPVIHSIENRSGDAIVRTE